MSVADRPSHRKKKNGAVQPAFRPALAPTRPPGKHRLGHTLTSSCRQPKVPLLSARSDRLGNTFFSNSAPLTR